jgi:nicotinamide mononucleotide transporter
MSPVESFAALLGVIAVWLTVRQHPWCWPIGLLMVLLYSWIFFDAQLYASALLQTLFAASQLYGWWQWTRGGEQANGRKVSRLEPPAVFFGLLLGAFAGLLLGFALQHWSDAQVPWWDAGLMAMSLLAQLWMAQKRLQCWPLWIAVDICYVWLFIDQKLFLTAGLYGLFTLLAIQGWRSWGRDPALQVRVARA